MGWRKRLAVIGVLGAVSLAAFQTAVAAAATLKADYWLQNSKASSVPSAPNLTDLIGCSTQPGTSCNAANAYARESVLGTTRYVRTFSQDNGVAIPSASSLATTDYTIAVVFRVSDLSGGSHDGFVRILDFSGGTHDEGLYYDGGRLDFFDITGVVGPATAANSYHEVVVTRVGSSKKVSLYLDGAFVTSFTDPTTPEATISSDLRFFQDDNGIHGTPEEDSAGAVARIELWNGALTATQVAALKPLQPKTKLSLSATSGPPGTSFTVSGQYFGPAETVKIYFKDPVTGVQTQIGSATTSVPGAFGPTTVAIPVDANPGTGKIVVRGAKSKLSKSTTFTVT
jgi:hypothetical protein